MSKNDVKTAIYTKTITEAHRAGIFVASPFISAQSSVGATSSGMWREDAVPDGAEIHFGLEATNMPRLTALGIVWETVFGATPNTATGTGALPSKAPAVRPKTVWGGRTGQRAFECVTMSEPSDQPSPRYVVCNCQHCDGHIEFDANEFAEENSIVPCPHCSLETKIFIKSSQSEGLLTELPASVATSTASKHEGFFAVKVWSKKRMTVRFRTRSL